MPAPAATAFICANDRLALGVYQALQEVGLSVPGEVSVVSFDDSELAGWMRPGLTSVALPHYDMGALALDRLLENRSGSEIHRCPMPISIRESVGRPR